MQIWSIVCLGALLATTTVTAKTHCKCLPGDPCFPSDAQWNAFAKGLSQPLISHQKPFASVCYNTSTDFDPVECASRSAIQFDAESLVEEPSTMQLVNFQDELLPNGTVLQCPFDMQPGGLCSQGRVPAYSINATTVSDIQKTVAFASQHNLHLVVHNTGYVGLSIKE
jgi:hypothetical protein